MPGGRDNRNDAGDDNDDYDSDDTEDDDTRFQTARLRTPQQHGCCSLREHHNAPPPHRSCATLPTIMRGAVTTTISRHPACTHHCRAGACSYGGA